MNPPTERQLDLLCFVAQYIEKRQHAPSIREICNGIGVSGTGCVLGHLERMERKGLVGRLSGVPRSLWVTGAGLDAVRAASRAD